jgi:fumarylacetoacetase
VLDLAIFAGTDGFSELLAVQPHLTVYSQSTLNDFASLGRLMHRRVRQYHQNVFAEYTLFSTVKDHEALQTQCFYQMIEK